MLILEVRAAMTNKLHTSLKTQEIFYSLGQSLNLQPFILSKLAIALSIRKGTLDASDFETDNNGLELSRQVIFGDHDLLFRSLIVQNEGSVIREEDYFPDLVKAHLDRGAKLLENEKRYTKDFYNHLCRLDSNL
jgi:DNA sulfur modification protein DndE